MSSTCKGCGAPITWAKTRDGKNLPLQKCPVYEIDWSRNDETEGPFAGSYQAHALKIERETYVSHFLTCPKANDFSKRSGR